MSKINLLMESGAGFAVVATTGMFDIRDWFIAVCTNDKTLIKKLRGKKNQRMNYIFEVPMDDKEVKVFRSVRNNFNIGIECTSGMVYEFKENTLMDAVNERRLLDAKIHLERLEKNYGRTQYDYINSQIHEIRKKIKKLEKKCLKIE